MLKTEGLNYYAERFINDIVNVNGQSEKTANSYASDLKVYFYYLKTKKNIANITDQVLNNIKAIDLNEYLGYIKVERDSSPATINRAIASLKKFFGYLFENEIIKENAALKLKNVKLPKRNPVYMQINEVKGLIKTVKKDGNDFQTIRNYCMFQIFLDCCLRISELTNLNLNYINLDKNFIDVIQGKGDKERIVFFNQETKKAINEWLKIRKSNSDRLFVSENGEPTSIEGIRYIINTRIKDAGLGGKHYTPHKLRHTGATIKHKNGVDVLALQAILGHSNVNTTQIYTHIDEEELIKAASATPSFL